MAIIDYNTFERLRAQGISDSTIADQMASSNKTFASHYDKIKKQTNNDPRAISSYLNYRFYGDANHTAPEPEKQKGYFGRTLDRMMKDAGDVRGALDSYNAGEQGAVNTTAQVAGNLFSGVLSPATEAVGTAVNKGLEVTGADEKIAQGVQSFTGSEFGQGLINSSPVQGTANYLQNNPTGKSIAAVGEAALDAGDVIGLGALGKGVAKTGVIQGAANAVRHPVQATGQALNATGRGMRAGFDNTAGALYKGFRGTADDVVSGADDAMEEVLTGVGKQAVKSGVDEKVVRFAGKLTPETKAIAKAMTKEADKGSKLLEGTVAHKELLGQQILSPLRHSLGIKQEVGKRLGAMKKARYGEPVDITEEFGTLQTKLAELGVEVGEKGKIASMGALADANKPILQKLVDFFGDADGTVIKDFEKIDQFRSRMFEELRSAKSKLANPSEAGAVFSQAEKLVDQFRRSLFIKAAGGDPSLIKLNDMYGEISSATKRFVQKSGIAQLNESKLNFDDITLKDLKAAEFSKRALGNASSNALSEIKAITELSKKLGFQSNVDVESLIHYTKALDNMYGITKAGSLQGEVQSAVQGAAGGVVNDLVRGVGPVRAGANVIGDQLINAFNKMTGITPERRTKLLLDLLDSDPEANLIETIRREAGSKFSDKVDDLVPDSAKVKDAKPAIKEELTPEEISD